MRYVTSVKYLGGFVLELEFDDGSIKKVDLKNYLDGEIFEPLKDQNYFKTVTVNSELDTIVWENGADFSPEFLYEIGEDISAVAKVS